MGLYANTHFIRVIESTKMIMSEQRLSKNPVFIMSLMRIYPLAKSIALGGVEIGIIKAQLAAKVTGMANRRGLLILA